MGKSRGLTSGIITSIASVLLVVGAGMLSISEGNIPILPTPVIYPTLPVYDYSLPTESVISPATADGISTQTPLQNVLCPAPSGWQPYRILPGDTLQILALSYPASPTEIAAANCLMTDSLPPDSILYLPPAAATVTLTATRPQPVCGPPAGWVPYLIQPQDNLFRLSLAFGISLPQLQFANCLGNSTVIYAGNYLMVPNVPTITPMLTSTATLTPSPSMTSTIIITPNSTFTITITNQPTLPNTLTPSFTPTETPTIPQTETPTSTPQG